MNVGGKTACLATSNELGKRPAVKERRKYNAFGGKYCDESTWTLIQREKVRKNDDQVPHSLLTYDQR